MAAGRAGYSINNISRLLLKISGRARREGEGEPRGDGRGGGQRWEKQLRERHVLLNMHEVSQVCVQVCGGLEQRRCEGRQRGGQTVGKAARGTTYSTCTRYENIRMRASTVLHE